MAAIFFVNLGPFHPYNFKAAFPIHVYPIFSILYSSTVFVDACHPDNFKAAYPEITIFKILDNGNNL